MLIDWFTVIAQIVNFLILVALLKHFLWGRLVRVIDDREQRVATQVAEAEKKNKTAEQKLEQIMADINRAGMASDLERVRTQGQVYETETANLRQLWDAYEEITEKLENLQGQMET